MTTTKVNYFAGRMHKLKSHDVKGMQIHNQREKESHTNTTIDETRTYLNYDLVNDGTIDYKSKIAERIEEAVESNRKIRKDAVVCNQWIITSDKTFFDRIGEDEEKRFFQESYKWFVDRYGKENVIFATVHKDEHTPHMHLGIIPIKEGKLSSKDLFNRVELKAIQDKFPKHVQSLGFNLERGIPNKQQHMEPVKFKNMQMQFQQKQIEASLNKQVKQIKQIREADRSVDAIPVKEVGLFKKNNVQVSKEDWNYVKTKAKQAQTYKYALEKAGKEINWMEQRIDVMKGDREKARKFDRLGELFGKEKIEEVLEVDKNQQRERRQQKVKNQDLERER